MNKLYFALAAFLCLFITSCDKEEAGGTEVEQMAGEWYVLIDAVDDNGDIIIEDPFGLGYSSMLSYNTNANLPTEMYLDDQKNFWEYKVKVNVDAKTMTFSTSGEVENMAYECMVNVTDGKIVKDGAVSPAGYAADSIEFFITFDDDQYPAAYGYSKYWVHGYRRTGLNGGLD